MEKLCEEVGGYVDRNRDEISSSSKVVQKAIELKPRGEIGGGDAPAPIEA